ncbi:unnamed protein product [Ixodes pacificus]
MHTFSQHSRQGRAHSGENRSTKTNAVVISGHKDCATNTHTTNKDG